MPLAEMSRRNSSGYLLPEFFFWHRRFDGDGLVRDRVLQLEAPGMERDAAVGIAARRTVLQVAPDGATHLGELTTYLMMAARL